MCDPLTIAGIALTGASSLAAASAQANVQKARDEAMAAERIRQKGFDEQADVVKARARDQYEDFAPKQEQRGKELAEFFQQQTATPTTDGGPTLLPQSSSNITVQAENDARASARRFTDRQAAALGDLRAFGDLMGTLGRGTAREAGVLGQIGGFKKGSSAVLPFELEAANSKGSGMKMLGDVLGGLGQVGLSAGLSGSPGSSLFGSPATTNFTRTNALGGFGQGGYTGMGPFTTVPTQATGLYRLFGG